MPVEAIAARWFGVRADPDPSTENVDAARSCDIVVFRRDTGTTVVTFSHTCLGDAAEQLTDLRVRLLSSEVLDFCRQVGMPATSVSGPGQDDEPDPLDPS